MLQLVVTSVEVTGMFRDIIGIQCLRTLMNFAGIASRLCRKEASPIPVAPVQPMRLETAFGMISMDVCGPYPTSSQGNKYVLVVIENVTKCVECYSIRTQDATLISLKFADYLSRHGTPKTLLTEQRRNFESQLMLEI